MSEALERIGFRVARCRNKKNGNTYFILHNTAEMKSTGPYRNWYRAVIYTDNVNIYCREENDFRDKFEMMEETATAPEEDDE